MLKLFFYIVNILFIFFYIYPGSLLGLFFYGNLNKQPKLTNDFSFIFLDISSNHIYAFLILSLLGFLNYFKSHKKIIISYFLLTSIILELMHLIIPNRSFEFEDLYGNILGVLISIIIFNLIQYAKKTIN